MRIARMLPHHWKAVKAIYEQGIATGNATFETAAPSWENWDKSHMAEIRIVALVDGVICGWAALSAVSTREVYRGVAEVTIYIHQDYRAQGIGSRLLQELINVSEQQNIWTLQSGIFPENYASIYLHERAGFRTVGYRERIAEMSGTWRDTVLMERRSIKVGKAAPSYKIKMKKILILCTGNSCRSQLAEGFLRHFGGNNIEVYSAGIETHGVNPKAIAVMKESGIDISGHTSNNINEYMDIDFDFVITVCDNAKESCPYFPSKAQKFHQNFSDPAKVVGTEEEIHNEFRKVRDLIKLYSFDFLKRYISK